MRGFCQRHDIRPYRPTSRYLRGNPEKQQAARDDLTALKNLTALKKKLKRDRACC
jgi:hypothetical protein